MERNKVKLSDKIIFGDENIYIQTMLNQKYDNILKLENQIELIKKTPCEIVRLSARNKEEIKYIKELKDKYEDDDFVFVADTHFNYDVTKEAIRAGIRKVRINPGNMPKDKLKEIISIAKDYGTVFRLGVNGGSVESKLGKVYNEDNVIDLLYEFIEPFEKEGFYNLVLSAKFSDFKFSIDVNKKIYNNFKYPLHIGVTEAGDLISSTIKHTLFFEKLLLNNIGNTIRVSISDDPIKEIEVANDILKILGLKYGIELISCPTCGRTWGDLIKLVKVFKKSILSFEKIYNLNSILSKTYKRNIKLAIMGCEVNGPGEAKDADIGLALMKNGILLFNKGNKIKIIRNKKTDYIKKEIFSYLFDFIKAC
ncbi:MAG: flavodoxin-dependent (E)-4-hydroxy-3-methylbut-2-enyl-diphosphate synthase [Spirochaetes bacterium]|nr:flavodoxin-dependent (E)-4-hydroxy-3-methylbut-2-enyl-diphosphate synthase [Spirochaetota bacterium]